MRQVVARALTCVVATGSMPPVVCDAPTTSSPFTYPELTAAIAQRREKEDHLRSYVKKVGPVLQGLRQTVAKCGASAAESEGKRCESARREYTELVKRVQRETAELTWGSEDAQARRAEFTSVYGCTGWTEEALALIKENSPIVELGAGWGQWEAELRRSGVDIVAYDNLSSRPRSSARKGQVHRGDERVLDSWLLQDRTLLVVYPEGKLLERCLRHYRGDVLIYVGEGRGGVNGGTSLFDLLEAEWDVVKVLPVKPFEGGHERLWVCRRKPKSA
ncbi:hypothetical protein HOP50_06g41250 [Chloropicon primus]|uniref:S-adenosyl-L-methionine-dependent methyltransferase n=2 Tax=Chloropicon primus TaxID=1764295 RepID=A0A5B8MLS1_9CHLO|nr:hypothetical protein A3770_06p41160 [Chloropicon primus]UPR00809.1 hypothetical protein HOP50_06g41250 [Chloropicon primus]|eukprot:QDZ21598.1 hypothetical protein A3770_06p41160 [Chloropicon primus]